VEPRAEHRQDGERAADAVLEHEELQLDRMLTVVRTLVAEDLRLVDLGGDRLDGGEVRSARRDSGSASARGRARWYARSSSTFAAHEE
jgi:hypothetical protein